MHMYTHICLSLSIYIYIYIHISLYIYIYIHVLSCVSLCIANVSILNIIMINHRELRLAVGGRQIKLWHRLREA